jgi:pimeloyl-ACP methyl ester carboxylesterase
VYERFAEREDGPVVVLVHGVGVSGRYLLPIAGRLAARCRVYVPDLPGFGRSGRLRGRATQQAFVEVLRAWLDAASLDHVDILIANSFGCQLAVELAAGDRMRVSRLVLVGPTVDPAARSATRQALRLVLDLVHEPVALWLLQAVDYTLHVAKSGLSAFAAMLRHPVELALPHVQVPTLVVRGERDRIVPHDWAVEVANLLPHGRLVEVDGAPHAVNYAAPDALAEIICELLDQPSISVAIDDAE